MDKKINHIQLLRRKQAKHVAALAKHVGALAEIEAELCPLLCEFLNEHGPSAGVSPDVLAKANEPK